MNKVSLKKEEGFISGAAVASIILGILCLVFGSVMIWALVNYNDQKNNVDSKLQQREQLARDDQKTKDQNTFDEKEKEPLKEFIGPNDLGRIDFKYPKTWSVYVANNGAKGAAYEAYLHPDQVPSVGDSANKFALRVSILDQPYDTVLQQYSGLVKQGQLRSSSITTSGYNGNRLDGNFTKDIEGSAVFFKIRDKTLVLKTDSPSFRPDFDDKIVKTLTFNQ